MTDPVRSPIGAGPVDRSQIIISVPVTVSVVRGVGSNQTS